MSLGAFDMPGDLGPIITFSELERLMAERAANDLPEQDSTKRQASRLLESLMERIN